MNIQQLITNLQTMPPESQVVLTDAQNIYSIEKTEAINDTAIIFLKEITKRGDIIEAKERGNEGDIDLENTIEIFGDLDTTGI